MNIIYLLVISTVLFSGCSSFRKMALGTATPMFLKSSKGFEKEPHWETFRDGIPSNLKLIDGLLEVRPEDRYLLASAIKGYAGYAFSVHETLLLEDQLSDRFESVHKKNAIAYYTKAFNYGLRFLENENVGWKELQTWSKDGVLSSKFDSRFSESQVDLEGVLFTAQSLASMVNLQRDNMIMLSYLPLAKSMFDWVCEKNPDIANGVCPLFYASYEAGRPTMLGGNPEKGRELFEKFISSKPHNWLARVAFMQFYIVPMLDEDLYQKQKSHLETYVRQHEKILKWDTDYAKLNESLGPEDLRLYQAVAIKRYKIIKKYESDLL